MNHSFEQAVGPVEQAENSVSSSTPTTSNSLSKQAPPPPSSEKTIRRFIRPQDKSAPVYHNYHGFRIDLNSASQQRFDYYSICIFLNKCY